jgi:antitoxin component YwqK of YwqJK toxin-antitoxin module
MREFSMSETEDIEKTVVIERWYENGQLSSRGMWNGPYLTEGEEWYENGKLRCKKTKDGSEEWNEKGNLQNRKTNEPDDEHIIERFYYEDGTRQSIRYKDHPDGLLFESWYRNGKLQYQKSLAPEK